MSGFQQDAFQANFQAAYAPAVVGVITDTYLWDPDLAECFEDAFERAGIAPLGVSQEHLLSAMRSTRFILNSEWSTIGIRQWQIVQDQQATTVGMAAFDLPAGCVDVFYAVLRRNGADTPMYPISRTDFNAIATKSRQARQNQYFVDKRFDRVTMHLWPRGENTTDLIIFDYFRQVADGGEMFNTLQMPAAARDCFVTGLAMRLAQKFNLQRYPMLKAEYGGPEYPAKHGGRLFHMRAETGERADVQITWRRRRR